MEGIDTSMPDLRADDFTRIATLYAPEIVSAIAFSPDGKYLAIAAGDKLHVHGFPANLSNAGAGGSTADFPRLVTLFMPDSVQSKVFSPDGKLITTAIADKVHIYRMPI